MGEFKKVASVLEIQPGTAKLVEIDGKRIALFNLDGTFYGIDDTCPHRGGPLSEGVIQGDSVVCPWHASSFSIKTGEVESAPAAEGVARYNVRVQGSDVEVEV